MDAEVELSVTPDTRMAPFCVTDSDFVAVPQVNTTVPERLEAPVLALTVTVVLDPLYPLGSDSVIQLWYETAVQ